jgi:PAS domain S-box-containing protein
MSSSFQLSLGGENGLEALWEDGERVFCRGWCDRADGSRESALVVLPAAEHPSALTLDRLAHEFSLKDEMDGAWAARPLELVRERGRTMLVLEDPGGDPLDRILGAPMEIGRFLHLAIEVAAALGNVHERGLVHKEIKPANILVNRASAQVRLTGFGIASRLPRQRQSPEPLEFIEGTLAYMAPEQTGRMNRSIDSRSDLYSFGVTLYQMLTGNLPFTASDAIEWVHCHIARKPVPPGERVKNIPAPLSAIIMKLLAKTAEERYQTAAGVESDLRHCLAEWDNQGRIEEFPVGEHDTPNRLLVPEKLYGRTHEIGTLLASFDRVAASGRPELVLVSGYSGIGKSAVVNELHKALVLPRGLFASGKFDQYKRDIPYATLAQAFQALIRQILSKSDEEADRWRTAVRDALDLNGQLIVNLVPELRWLIGEQPPVPELPPQEEERRFHTAFRSFLGVFAREEHPLALFLDDLQWLDTATLKLVEHLVTHPDVRHLLLVGAFRDNELSAAHPLMRTFEAIRQTTAVVRHIELVPLSLDDITELAADTLRCERRAAGPLARLAHQKTLGNPFFAIQFLTALREEHLLEFDAHQGIWTWDLDRIQARGFTDNVVDLMVSKLERLPASTQETLKQLACLGNSAEVGTLAIVHGTSEQQVHSDLWDAVRLEFVVRLERSYKFVHDRVQEAAYSLIPEELRAAAHLRIGRLLTAHVPPETREQVIFEIVNQLNRGATLITSRDEREQLAELNLVAGRRARASSAYASALKYLSAGVPLLADDCWERRYELTFALEWHRAECEFLTGELAAATERLTVLSSRATGTVERATVACLHMNLFTMLNQSDRAVTVCLDYLRHLGVEWSPHPTKEEARREYERIWSQLGGRTIEELLDIPLMTDPASRATLDVLTMVLLPAKFTDANLYSLAICWAVNLSLERGNSDGSCIPYASLGVIAGPHFGNYKAGFQFGRLGYELVDKRGLNRFQARTYVIFGNHVMPWTKHVKASRDLLRRAFDAANKSGDLAYTAVTCENLNTNLLAVGDPLVDAQREAENSLEFAQKARFGFAIDTIVSQLGLIRTLRGLTPQFGSFDDEQFDELRFEHRLASDPVLALPACCYWIRKLQACFSAGHYGSGVDASLKAQRLLWTLTSTFETAEYHFYSALCHAASFDSAPPDQRTRHLEALAAHNGQLEVWAENCPANFENRAALVGAELSRIEDRALDAERLYEKAIRSAQANGFVHNEALANELAARFYAARGFEKIAHAYLRDARHCYLYWGATGKVRQLDQLYPHLKEQAPVPGSTSTIAATVEHLELATVIKVSQAISGEIVPERLIDTLMRIALEHAGAERGLLILPRGGEQRIEAEATTSGDTVVVRLRGAPLAAAALPESIVHYVVHTRESVILDDASTQNPFSADTYIDQHHARSILCLPLIKQATLIGVLYLENNLMPQVFTPTRVAVLELLASQAAISLENTRLYADLEEREAKIRRLVEANIMGVFIWNVAGEIIEANDAFLQMVQYRREDLSLGRVRWTELTPPEWRDSTQRALEELKETGTAKTFEKEYFRNDGSRVPVLVGSATFGGRGDEGVAFVVDLTERKRAEAEARESERRYGEIQTELEHANRVATMGHLSASIAHEVNQPIAATLINAQTALRLLTRQPPDVERATQAIDRVVNDGNRAADIVHRTRELFKKAPARNDALKINEAILEVIGLTRSEMSKSGVLLQTRLVESLPLIQGDRVQLQQVMLNLIINAAEAMSEMSDGHRHLLISTGTDAGCVLVTVRDSGPGLPEVALERVFDAFYTTKSSGLGMGLSICRSIVEAHGGRLWATANVPQGATFQFTVPVHPEPTKTTGAMADG